MSFFYPSYDTAHCRRLHVFLVALASIFSLHALDTTNDPQGRYSITFVVVTGPTQGRRFLKEN